MPWTPKHLTKTQLEERRLEAARLFQTNQHTQTEIALILGVSQAAISQWKTKLDTDGIHALKAKPHPGPGKSFDQNAQTKFLEAVKQGPLEHGFENNRWTLQRLAEVFKRSTGVRLHPHHIGKLMKTLGWSPQKPQKKALERNDEKIQTWVETTYPGIVKRGSRRTPPSSSLMRSDQA